MKKDLENNLLKACQRIGEQAGERFLKEEITQQQMEKVYHGLVELASKGKEILSVVNNHSFVNS
jgi:hypothetical protein